MAPYFSFDPKNKIAVRTWLVMAALLLLALWLLWLWYGQPHQPPAKQWLPAPELKQVAGVPRVGHPAPPRIRVIPKQVAAKALRLPPELAADDRQQVVSTATVPAAPHGASTITVMDTTSGEARTLVKINPRPLLSFERGGAAGGRYGIDSHGDQQVVLFVRQDVARIGNIYLALTAEGRMTPASGRSDAWAGAEVRYQW